MKKFRPSRRAAIAMRAELNRYRHGATPAPVYSDYALRESCRRFVVYVDGRVHCETVDSDHAKHVARLLTFDGLAPSVRSLTANQES
jgi:hypothetical protein